MSQAPVPHRMRIDQADLVDLAKRLERTRLPEKETVDGWQQGAPLAYITALLDHWRSGYDMQRVESWFGRYPGFKVTVDGLDIHALHIRSPRADALPLIITHGWPGSVLEFAEVIGPLTDPDGHGAAGAPAFHLVLPSLPGYGCSGKPDAPGWTVKRIAAAWDQLMRAFGYTRWFAQGGDWGAMVTAAMAAQNAGGVAGIHLNMVIAAPPEAVSTAPDPFEQESMERFQWYNLQESGYSTQQATKPQTIGYALADSPVGQLAWIAEKLHGWTDCDDDPLALLGADRIIDAVMIYWLNNSAASSARLYWESFRDVDLTPVTLPMGGTIYPKELFRTSRRWAETRFSDIVFWRQRERGGHFAAMEQPASFVEDLRDCFGAMTL